MNFHFPRRHFPRVTANRRIPWLAHRHLLFLSISFSPLVFSCTATTLGECIAFTFHTKTNELIFTRDLRADCAYIYVYIQHVSTLSGQDAREYDRSIYYFHDFIHIYIHRMLFLWMFCTRKYIVRTEYVIPLLRILMEQRRGDLAFPMPRESGVFRFLCATRNERVTFFTQHFGLPTVLKRWSSTYTGYEPKRPTFLRESWARQFCLR